MSELQKRIADVLFFQSPAFTKKRQPCYRSEFDPIADKVIAAIGDSGLVVVDRARFERLRDAAGMAADEWGADSRVGLLPGDLEPL